MLWSKVIGAGGSGEKGISFLGRVSAGKVAAHPPPTVSLSSLGLEEGDLLIALCVQTNFNTAPTSEDGTTIFSSVSTGTIEMSALCYYAAVPSAPQTTLSANFNYSSLSVNWIIVSAYRGVDLSQPLDVSPSVTSGTPVRQVNPPPIFPVTPGALVIGGGARSTTASTAGAAYTSSDLDNFNSYFTDLSNYDAIIAIGDSFTTTDPSEFIPNAQVQVASSVFGTVDFTLVLKPA